jgi:hypothetical protein
VRRRKCRMSWHCAFNAPLDRGSLVNPLKITLLNEQLPCIIKVFST